MLAAIIGLVVLSCSESSNPLQVATMEGYDISVPAKAEQIKEEFSGSYSYRFFIECTGEFVSGVVEYRGQIFITIDAQGGFHGRTNTVFNGWAVGETTGTEFLGRQTDPESYQLNNNGTLTHSYSHSAKFISKGGADNYLSHFLFLITITPDGTVRHELEEFIYDGCRG